MPRSAIKFAIGSNGESYTSVWRVFSTRDDVYLTVISLGGFLKASFHADGNCHFGVTASYRDRLSSAGRQLPGGRHFARWRRPELANRECWIGATIQFPSNQRRAVPLAVGNVRQLILLPSAAAGKARCVHVLFCRSNSINCRESDAVALGQIPLPCGITVHLVTAEARIAADSMTGRSHTGRGQSLALEEPLGPGAIMTGLSAILMNKPSDGETLNLTELAEITMSRASQ